VVHQVNELVITASVPGINPADIKVNIDDGVLTIRAETPRVEVQGVEGQGDSPDAPEDQAKHAESEYLRRERQTGSFARSVKLPDTVDQDKVTSEYANGVLTIGLPKAEVTRPREITVKVA
jgi:HSP20 family protein